MVGKTIAYGMPVVDKHVLVTNAPAYYMPIEPIEG